MQATRVFWQRSGSRPVVLLHGFTGAPASWRRVAACLCGARDRTVVALSLPGHHRDVPVAAGWDHNLAAIAGRVRDLVAERARPRPAHVCGYSLGARAALGLALDHPALVARLTLIGGHPGLADARARAERVARDRTWIDLLQRAGIAAFVAAWEAQPIFAGQAELDDAARAEQRRVRLAHDAAALAASLATMGLGQMPDYRARWRELAVPVTLMTGELDRTFTELASELSALDTGSGRASHLAIPGCGHNVVLERPGDVAEALARIESS